MTKIKKNKTDKIQNGTKLKKNQTLTNSITQTQIVTNKNIKLCKNKKNSNWAKL